MDVGRCAHLSQENDSRRPEAEGLLPDHLGGTWLVAHPPVVFHFCFWQAMGVMSLRVAITTLGCKVNRADADALWDLMADFAHEVPFSEPADLYIINSCTVTATADRQSRQMVHRARRRGVSAKVVLTGCMAARESPQALEVDGIFPFLRHGDLVEYARGLDRVGQEKLDDLNSAASTPSAKPSLAAGVNGSRARPFLKIQDGCDAACTYCVVSVVRGPSRSISPEQVMLGLERLAVLGHGEVVLTGIHLGRYGADLDPPTTLAKVVERNLGLVPRLRLSSVEPLEVDDHLARLLCEVDALCPHLHVPIQSGDDSVLRAMDRPYNCAQVLDLLHQLRGRRDDMALGADLMTGFPGESAAQFDRTLRLVHDSPLTHLHVFPYSPRPGTVAAGLPHQVPGPEARARAAALRHAGEAKLAAFAASQVGRTRKILVERRSPGNGPLSGITDNYLRVTVEGGDGLLGRLVDVQLEAAEGPALRGRLA